MTTTTAPDQLVRLLATDGYDVHRLIYQTFATGDGRDFLYAPFAVAGDLHAVFVRRFDVATRFAAGMEFAMTLRAMPAVKTAGRRRSIGASRTKDRLRLRWIEARAREHGFALLAAPGDGRRARAARDGKDPVRFQRLHLPRPDPCHRRGAFHPRLHPRDRAGPGVGLRDGDSSRGLTHIHEHLPLDRHDPHPAAACVQSAGPPRPGQAVAPAAHAGAERRGAAGHCLPLGRHHPGHVPPRERRCLARARGDDNAAALSRTQGSGA